MIDAAIVILIYRAFDGELHRVLILRKPGGVHGDQVAFPGGKHDPKDETMLDTALREVREELGLIVERADVLAELPMMRTRTTGYRVFPCVARINVPERWQIAEREIAAIIDVRLSDLNRPGAHDKMIERFPIWEEAEQVNFFQIGHYRLWGLSYRISHPIISRLVAGEWGVSGLPSL